MRSYDDVHARHQRQLRAEARVRVMDSAALIGTLAQDDPELACAAAERIADRDLRAALPKLREVLSTTDQSNLRNTCALALSDMLDDRCVERLLALLQDPKTAGRRGTLLYALRPFDLAPHLALLVEIALTDGYEARHTALDLLEEFEESPPPEALHAGQQRVADFEVSDDDAEGHEIRACLLEWFAERVP